MSPSPTPALRVLIVDDDIVDLEAARRAVLGAYPRAVVVEAHDGVGAMDAMRASAPDCVLCDLRLPGHDGRWVLERVRESGIDVPIIILTGQGDEKTAVELMKSGAADYISKGDLSSEQISKSVRHALRVRDVEASERRARRDLERYAEQLRALAEAAHATNAILSVEAVAQTIADHARSVVSARVAVVRVLCADARDEIHRTSLAADYTNVAFAPARPGALAEILPRLAQVQRVLSDDLHGEALAFVRSVGLGAPLRGWMAGVLAARGGRPIGVLHVSDKSEGEFTANDEVLIAQLSQLGAVAIENARLFEQANMAARARDDMIAVVSHDLRNPLNTIVMGCALMLDANPVPESSRTELVRRVDRAARRMQALVSDLLDVTRIESGQLVVTPENTAVPALIDEAIELVSAAADEKKVVIEKLIDPHVPTFSADRERILQVFGNLLGNAVKFSARGGRISVCARAERDGIVFSVKDAGPGIAAEDLAHVFDRYWKARATSKLGTGLGLFIAKGILDAHGGRIWAESEVGKGASFSFALPFAQADVA